MKNHVTAEQDARDMLERMGVPDAQEYSAGDLVELANLIVSADTPVALAEAYRCGKEAGDAEIAELRQQLAEAQADAIEQARIVGMGGEREIDLRQKLDIVSSLLREASGRMSYGHWSTLFRARVETALKTKGPKP